MTRKIISWLSFLAVFIFILQSCVHDEMYSASDPASKQYNSKSLWKEDEIYIKNVMQVYFENETEIKKTSGTPYWDYATTVNTFDESFLMVPIVEGKNVVSVLKVPRHGSKIYFYDTNSPEDLAFFQGLIFSKYKKVLHFEDSPEASKTVCTRQWISIWMPDNPYETDPNSGNGHWDSRSVIVCKQLMDNCLGIVMPNGECSTEGGGGDYYPYPGGGGNSQPQQQPKTPCEKTKDIISNPKMQAGLTELKDQSTQGGEKGIKFKADGTPSATIIGSDHFVNLGDKTGYEGGYHNHTPTGIPMLSPPDIDQLLGFAKAQPTSNPANVNNAYLGMIAPNGMHYVIHFNGTYDDAIKTFSQEQLDEFSDKYSDLERDLKEPILNGTKYINSNGKINNLGVETLFFETLKKMGLEGKVNLQRVETNGIIQNINLDNNNTPNAIPCS